MSWRDRFFKLRLAMCNRYRASCNEAATLDGMVSALSGLRHFAEKCRTLAVDGLGENVSEALGNEIEEDADKMEER